MIEIREPKFKAGERVIDKNGDVSTVINVNHYYFDKDEYWYNIEKDETIRLKPESKLEPYIEKPNSVWDLKEGDTYYLIDVTGAVIEANWLGYWLDYDNDKRSRKIGNAFLTKEEAEYELERRKVETEMLRLGGRRHLKLHKENYCFCFDSQFSSISCECFSCLGICSSIYFDSEKEALKALNTIGKDKIKKYIFGVEE